MNKRVFYFDFLKVIASIAVVLIHVISEYWYDLDVTSFDFKLLTTLDSLSRFCVPVYFLISGALFLNEEKEITIKKIFGKYIIKIFIIFIIWNMIYSVCDILFLQNATLTFKDITDSFISTILGKGVFHLRFLVIILGFYLCVPILRLITKKENKKILEYLILILFIGTSLNEFILPLFKIKLLYPLLFSGFILYFILGYYLNTFKLSKKSTNIIYILGILSVIVTMILSVEYSIYLKKPTELFFNYLSPNIVLFSSFLFLFLKNNYKPKNGKILTNLGTLYLGVYLIHGLILGFYLKIGLFNINTSLIIKVIIGTIVVYMTCFIVSYIISKIPFVKKIIYL